MKRREFLLHVSSVVPAASLLTVAARSAGAAASFVEPPPPPRSGWRTFEIEKTVEITEPAGRTLLWVPLPASARTDYQRLLDMKWTASEGGQAEYFTAPGYDVSMFGGWEMNWIVYNHGHDVALPKSRGLPASFLMYPNAETAEGRLDSLNPATFRYAIHSREIEPT